VFGVEKGGYGFYLGIESNEKNAISKKIIEIIYQKSVSSTLTD